MSSIATPDPRLLPPDPRLPFPSTYSRDAVVEALESFYRSLPHIEPSSVQAAPPDGWPGITAENVAACGLNKTDEVVALMAHMPYIDGRCPWIAPMAFCVDYRKVVAERSRWPVIWRADDDEPRFPSWVLQLTTGADGGSADYILDTMDGTITKYTNSGPVYPDPPGRYGADDPRAWRDEWCEDLTVSLLQQTREWRTQYRTLALLGMPGNLSWPGVLARARKDGFMWEETERMSHIYREHGWPDNYRGDQCRKALRDWWSGR